MPTDFSAEYVQRGDDELLRLATQRHSLTTEAATALDAELRRRNLTESDRVEHQKFAKRQERKEHNRRRRKLFGKRQSSWLELLSGFGALGVIAWAYFSLPKRYHLTADWEETAVSVVIPAVFVIVGWRSLWREVAYWLSLILSSAIQLAIVHVWVQRAGGELSRGAGKLATLLGFGLFLAVYGFITLVRRNFYGEESTQVR